MTQEDIIRMAREVGAIHIHGRPNEFAIVGNDSIKAFAALVAAAEREACAKVCDDKHDTWRWDDEPDSASGPRDCAAAIRARGQA